MTQEERIKALEEEVVELKRQLTEIYCLMSCPHIKNENLLDKLDA